MITAYTKYLLLIVILITLMTSCYSLKYYNKVVNNVGDFDLAISRIQNQNMIIKKDSLLLKNGEVVLYENSTCLYYEDVSDSLLTKFMEKYELKRICFSLLNNEYFDSVITFHKDYTPFMGKAVIISYDFGTSGLRKKIRNGNKLKDEDVKIINDFYLYRVKSKPSFGE